MTQDEVESAPLTAPGMAATPRTLIGDRTRLLLLGFATLLLLAAIAFAWWITSSPPLHPIPVPSSPRA